MKMTIREYCKQLYANSLMKQIDLIVKGTTIAHEQTDHLNSPLSIHESEFVITNFPKKENPRNR